MKDTEARFLIKNLREEIDELRNRLYRQIERHSRLLKHLNLTEEDVPATTKLVPTKHVDEINTRST